MALQFKADEPVGRAIRRIAETQLDRSLADLQNADEAGTAEVVHAVRKRLKKVRALIRLTRGGLGRKRSSREDARFRDAGRPLSEVRDAEVLVQTLDRLAEWSNGRAGPEALGAVREFLLGLQSEVGRRVLDEGKALGDLVATLEDARGQVKRWDAAGPDWDALEVGVRWIYKRGLKAFREATEAPTDEGLHEWRKRVKDLWYALDILLPIRPRYTKARSKTAHKLADRLGDDHDLAILRQSLATVEEASEAAASAAVLLPLIDERRAELQREASTLGQDLYGERPRVFVARIEAYWRAWKAEAEAARFDLS